MGLAVLTYALLFAIPGCLAFGGGAWLWRSRTKRPRAHWLLAIPVAAVAWFGSWLFGLWLFLDVIKGGTAGAVAGQGLFWSLIPAIVAYQVLRKRNA